MLRHSRRISVRELAVGFAVSEMTIRRDLAELEEQNLLTRTHGGAVPSGALRLLEQGLPPLMSPKSPARVAIGKLAAGLVSPGQRVALDTGATALEVARHLPRDANLTVATTSLSVAQELFGTPITVVLFGGILRKEFPSLYGPLTEANVKNFHVDILYTGCDGARSDDGFYTVEMQLSALEQAIAGIADRVVVVTESRKFGRTAFARFAAIEDVDTVVTDAGLSLLDRQRLEERGVTVLIADE